MKVIEHALEVLPQSPVRIAAAVQTAGDTMLEQGNSFVSEVSACAESLKTDMLAVAEQMKAIPALLDPQPILDCCIGVLETAAADLRKLASDAVEIPQRLLEQAAGAQKVVDAASDAVQSMSTLLPELAELVPDFTAQMQFVESLPARGAALVDLATRSGAMVEQYGRDLLPLSAQLQSLALLQGGPGAGARDDRNAGAKGRAIAGRRAGPGAGTARHPGRQCGRPRRHHAGRDGAGDRRDRRRVQPGRAEGRRPCWRRLQAQIDWIGEVRAALADEAQACDRLFDEGCAQVDRLGDILMKPLATARAQVDVVIGKLAEAAASVDAMVAKARVPLDGLDARVDIITEALRGVVEVIRQEVAKVLQLLRELDDEAENAKIALRALPEQFAPVRSAIADAVAMLVGVKNQIPPFVGEANSALSLADNELDQAAALCASAIEICTRYMMKAPGLMLARTLFVGLQAMIPPVKAAIASARTVVATAGTQAAGLMDQAIGLVESLNPLLDQALAQLQVAIDALLALLEQMQMALLQVATAAEAMPPLLQEQVDKACTAAHAVLDKVRAAVDQCLSQLQCEALVQRLRQELSDLLDRTFAPLEAQLERGRRAAQAGAGNGQGRKWARRRRWRRMACKR